MFTTDSPADLRFFNYASSIIKDIHESRRIEWLDEDTLSGSRTGTLRGFIDDGGDDFRRAIVRITLDGGWEHEVPLVDLMNALTRFGYFRR